ncbi:hypothetical protein [Evansella cellulosilytica]|uniref:Uncharacterized protein n=1 Tax=Evansella cellulosilytica (strain ATCC 21833 / DSM 2522 / FERM P-1141 / JCM 9156 / N-4) TaxID=649639 RepID=E6TRF8_EVAC2|nr:hypothetical protein [Evansella cellulosilytica]ADU31788.1 hypothetical protein Bcell_3547 [Evansella cellulosilytica DSM 2522]
MKKILWILFTSTLLVLTACNSGGDEDAAVDASEETANEDVEEEGTSEEEQDNDVTEETEETEAEEATEEEEELLGLDLRELDIDEITLDLETWTNYDPETHKIIEFDQRLYFNTQLLSDLLEADIRYDATNFFAEAFVGETEYTHTTVFEDRSSELLEVNEYWRHDTNDYWSNDTERTEDYHFIESDGELFVPERVVEMIYYTAVNQVRQENKMEFGVGTVETNITDVEFVDGAHSTVQERTSFTYQGENLGEGLEVEYSSFSRNLEIQYMTNGDFAEVELELWGIEGTSELVFIVNGAIAGEKVVETFTLEEESHETITIPIGGYNGFRIETENSNGKFFAKGVFR